MTNFYGNASIADTNTGMPGAAPLGAQMQGNPYPPGDVPDYPPAPQTGPTQVVGVTPDTNNQISDGNIPVNAQPTNVLTAPGLDSFLAQVSRGQLSLNQSNYGQGGFMPPNAGSSPQNPQAGSVTVASVAAGSAAVPTFANPANYTGN